MTTSTIGEVPLSALNKQIDYYRALTGNTNFKTVDKLQDVPETGPKEIKLISKVSSEQTGAILMSSGGTTGLPKLTYVCYDQGHKKLLSEWPALNKEDVVLNLFNAGKLWGSHYHVQGLTQQIGCTVVPTGPIEASEAGKWLTILEEVNVTTLAGNPSGLYDFALGCLQEGKIQRNIKKIIWLAEPWTPIKRTTVEKAFPNAEFWGNYGSVETFIIGISTPACNSETLHLLKDQVIETDKNGALLTRVGTGWTVPTLRYRLGDIITPAVCQCGRPYAFHVQGRADGAIILRGLNVNVDQMLGYLRSLPGIDSVQLRLSRDGDTPRSARHLTIDYIGYAPVDIRASLLKTFFHLKVIDDSYPDAIIIRECDKLARIERTNKIPNIVWE